MNPDTLITGGAVLAAIGVAMVWASRPSPGRRPRGSARRRVGWVAALAWSAVAGSLIGAVQWVSLGAAALPVTAGIWPALLLEVPALLAGATLVRLALVLAAAWRQRRRRREIRRMRGEQR